MRKEDGADGQTAKVMGNFTTYDAGEEYSWSVPFLLSHSALSTWVVEVRQCVSCVYLIVSPHIYIILFAYVSTDTTDVVPSGTIISTTASTALPPRPSASSETAGEPTCV